MDCPWCLGKVQLSLLMKKVIIIGSGIAGLNAASILSSRNYQVTLLEASPKFGGKTYSFKNSETDEIIDNGQHILMGCYDHTIRFLKLIGAEDKFVHQKNLYVKFLTNEKKEYSIDASKFPYPINLLKAIFNYSALDFYDKIRFLALLIKLPFISEKSLENLNVKEWLERENQTPTIIKSFWEILCIGALNTTLEKASAKLFHKILLQMFFSGNFASTIILPKYGLSESIINPALSFIKNNRASVISSEQVKEIVIEENKVIRIMTDKNIYEDFDFLILAIPEYSLQKINCNCLISPEINFTYSTILNIHIWLKENPVKEKFFGLIDSPLHWIFNKDSHLNIVISNANQYSKMDNVEILKMVMDELEKFTEIKISDLSLYKIIREKRATFIPDKSVLDKRPENKTNVKNLFLAGDWTNTDLPATIESATKSGETAANLILSNLN